MGRHRSTSSRFPLTGNWRVCLDTSEPLAVGAIEVDPPATGSHDDSNVPAHEAPSEVASVLDQDRGVGDRELGVRDAKFCEDFDDGPVNLRLGQVVHGTTPSPQPPGSVVLASGECIVSTRGREDRSEQNGPSQERLPLRRAEVKHDRHDAIWRRTASPSWHSATGLPTSTARECRPHSPGGPLPPESTIPGSAAASTGCIDPNGHDGCQETRRSASRGGQSQNVGPCVVGKMGSAENQGWVSLLHHPARRDYPYLAGEPQLPPEHRPRLSPGIRRGFHQASGSLPVRRFTAAAPPRLVISPYRSTLAKGTARAMSRMTPPEGRLAAPSTVVGHLVPEWEEPVLGAAEELVDGAVVEDRPFPM